MTTFPTPTWEHALLSLAYEARTSEPTSARLTADKRLLDRAYAYCEEVTAAHSRSFHLASRLLPAGKRRAVRALYAFCRVTDDIVDGVDSPDGLADPTRDRRIAEEALASWRASTLSSDPPTSDLVAVAWADTRLRYGIPLRYAEQLIEGVSSDLQPQRYGSFEALAAYAYGVASTVGLMSMHIIGFSGREAMPYAIKLGVALQLTNILRDVGEDWRAGRLYLPADELAAFGLSEAGIAAGRVDDNWRAFMRFQIMRNRRLYAEAWPGIALLARDGRLAIAAAGDLYRAILDDIEAHDYDVFSRRAHVSRRRKLLSLPGIYWRTNH